MHTRKQTIKFQWPQLRKDLWPSQPIKEHQSNFGSYFRSGIPSEKLKRIANAASLKKIY